MYKTRVAVFSLRSVQNTQIQCESQVEFLVLNRVVSRIRSLGFKRLKGYLVSIRDFTERNPFVNELPWPALSKTAPCCRTLSLSAPCSGACGSVEGHIKLYWTGATLQCLATAQVVWRQQRIGGVTLTGDA